MDIFAVSPQWRTFNVPHFTAVFSWEKEYQCVCSYIDSFSSDWQFFAILVTIQPALFSDTVTQIRLIIWICIAVTLKSNQDHVHAWWMFSWSVPDTLWQCPRNTEVWIMVTLEKTKVWMHLLEYKSMNVPPSFQRMTKARFRFERKYFKNLMLKILRNYWCIVELKENV